MAYSSIKTNVFNLCSQLLYMEICSRAFSDKWHYGSIQHYNKQVSSKASITSTNEDYTNCKILKIPTCD